MKRRWIQFLILGAILVLGAWLLASPLRRWLRTPPQVRSAVAAVKSGQFDVAETQLNEILALHPDDSNARMLMAQVMMERPDPQPAAALEHLGRIHPGNPRSQAHLKVFEGKALFESHRLAQAEQAWAEALRLEPRVPEAGWLLLQVYNLQGRDQEARSLALRLFSTETDPRDRVGFLMELVREDVEKLAAAGLIPLFEPAVASDPDDWRSRLALGQALVREGRTADGITLLRDVVSRRSEDVEAWDAFLTGVGDGGDVDALAAEWARVPAAIVSHPRLAQHRGRVALERRDYPAAVAAYQSALAVSPTDTKIMHRLGRALRYVGKSAEAQRIDLQEHAITTARKELKDLYRQAASTRTLGILPEEELYQKLAVLLERLGKNDEALAWHQLVLRSSPGNTVSLSAVTRLKPLIDPH